jgi:GrpB-like predicted nucleotidyltransferase (UPF0157 family)
MSNPHLVADQAAVGSVLRHWHAMPRNSAERREAAAKDLAAVGGHDARVDIAPYDPGWPARFDAEAKRLQRFVPVLTFHHVGSTSVPGLAAKPVIDMMALTEELDEFVAPIIEAGYQYPQAYNAILRRRRWFCRPSAAVRTHHLHIVADRAELDRHLRVRDMLRQRADLASQYAALKLHLANSQGGDREAYTAGKSAFIEHVESSTRWAIGC